MRRIFPHLPLILMIGVALSQVYLSFGENVLVPDKGGGFGLFSTVDRLNLRSIKIAVIDLDGTESYPKILRRARGYLKLRALAMEAMSLPSERKLGAVLDHLKTWPFSSAPKKIRVEIWKISYRPQRSKIERVKIAEQTLPFQGSD